MVYLCSVLTDKTLLRELVMAYQGQSHSQTK
jgi:hypothetical protein